MANMSRYRHFITVETVVDLDELCKDIGIGFFYHMENYNVNFKDLLDGLSFDAREHLRFEFEDAVLNAFNNAIKELE